MICFCGAELVHGGDHDLPEDEDFGMESNLHCSACERVVMVYTPRNDGSQEEQEDVEGGGRDDPHAGAAWLWRRCLLREAERSLQGQARQQHQEGQDVSGLLGCAHEVVS